MQFLSCFGGSRRPVIPVVIVLCILFSMKDAKSDIPRRRAGTKVKFLYVSCLPSFLPLVFYHILPELFLSMGSQQEDHILHREWGVKFMQRQGMCYGKNYLLHGVSLEGQSLVRVLRTAALYLSHGRATLLPASCCRCQKHLCKVVMQTCHLQEAQNGPTWSVLPCSHLCSERGESAASEKVEGQEQKVLDVLELGHILARQHVQLAGPFMQLRAFQRCHAVVQHQESIRTKADSCFCYLLAMDLRRSQLASLILHLLAYKIRTLIGICIVLCEISEIKYMFNGKCYQFSPLIKI